MEFYGSNLTYCMNVHPASHLDDVLKNIRNYAIPIKENVCPDRPFGLGLWIPSCSVTALWREIIRFKNHLADHGFYVFTINGFPMGPFHGTRVKKNVYSPSWLEPERLKYTMDLIRILAELLPEDCEGSVSTVPIGYGKLESRSAFDFLLEAVDFCRDIFQRKSKKIYIAIEPEPDCYLETTEETIQFFTRVRELDPEVDEFLGVCFDTCHFCIQGEDLAHSLATFKENNVTIPKVQISAALEFTNSSGVSSWEVLQKYAEPIYLHQTRVFDVETGKLTHRFSDLGEALSANPLGKWRIHFHIPMYFGGTNDLQTTRDQLTPNLFKDLFGLSKNIEIETYTFNVLPDQSKKITDSIVDEFKWLLERVPIS